MKFVVGMGEGVVCECEDERLVWMGQLGWEWQRSKVHVCTGVFRSIEHVGAILRKDKVHKTTKLLIASWGGGY